MEVKTAIPKQKICVGCNGDVSGRPRTKDQDGNYYCARCWREQTLGVTTSEPDPTDLRNCPLCNGVFAMNEMDASGVCCGCAVAQVKTTFSDRSKNPKSGTSFWKTDTGLITAIITPIALVGLLIVGWLLWSSHADQQVRDHATEMKSTADAQLVAGDVEAALTQYAGLLEYAKSHHWAGDVELLTEVQREQEIAQTRATQQTEVAAKTRELQSEAEAARRRRSQAIAANDFLIAVKPFAVAIHNFNHDWVEQSAALSQASLGPEYLSKALNARSQMFNSFHALCDQGKIVDSAAAQLPPDAVELRPFVEDIKQQGDSMMALEHDFSEAASALMQSELNTLSGNATSAEGRAGVVKYSQLLDQIVSASSAASGSLLKIEPLAFAPSQADQQAQTLSSEAPGQATADAPGNAGATASLDYQVTLTRGGAQKTYLVIAHSVAEAKTVAESRNSGWVVSQVVDMDASAGTGGGIDNGATRKAHGVAAPSAPVIAPDVKYMDRAFTDPLIVVGHNGAVAERQYCGFFGDNKPEDVYMRGSLRLARSYFGKQDVFCLHPWSEQQPATADFSAITTQTAGVLILNVHNLFDPTTGQAGHCHASFKVDGTEVHAMAVEGNVWHEVQVPFDHNHVEVEVSAVGWFWEHAFFTYAVSPNGTPVAVNPSDVVPLVTAAPTTKDDGNPANSGAARAPQPDSSNGIDPRVNNAMIAAFREKTQTNLDNDIAALSGSDESTYSQFADSIRDARKRLHASRDSSEKHDLQEEIRDLQKQQADVNAKVQELRSAKDKFSQMTDNDIAVTLTERLHASDRHLAAQEQAQKESEAAARNELAAVRAAKWPNWNGPWKTCPMCGGTGRDSDAERKANSEDPRISQIAGTGTSGHFAGAKIPCGFCGGTGQVPDAR